MHLLWRRNSDGDRCGVRVMYLIARMSILESAREWLCEFVLSETRGVWWNAANAACFKVCVGSFMRTLYKGKGKRRPRLRESTKW